ncbi:Beta-galactosidase 8 [Glycine max]|nr:Beta-galactosidase 8 [Glycine max]
MLKKQSVLSLSLVMLISFMYSTTTLAQLSPASAPLKPPQPAPTIPAAAPQQPLVPSLPQSPSDSTPESTPALDIVGILRKAKSFNILIRLMKTTQLINQLNAQLLTTKSGGITILAPDDSAFSELKAGFLNSLSDGQKLELLQFHVLSDYVSSSNFDTLTNPVRTLAGAKPGKVELNVISYGGSVNISTGEVNTTITGIIYTDKHLAIYKVGKVLLPTDFFAVTKAPAKSPSLAPEPSSDTAKAPKADKDESSSSDSSQVNPTEQNSGTEKIAVYGMWMSLGLGALLMKPSAKAPKADKENSLCPDSSESSQINSTNENSGTVKIYAHGKFVSFGDVVPHRPVEDLAFAVARFYQRGNEMMPQLFWLVAWKQYHGGTNFGRTTGGPFISTSYDFDTPIDEYGIIRQPKWDHLKNVHKAIKLCEKALLATGPTITYLGPNIEAAVYNIGAVSAAFLANIAKTDAKVSFNGNSYHLPAWYVSTLPDCKSVVLNTAKINSASMISSFTTESLKEEVGSLDDSGSGWSWISEPIGISKAHSFSKFWLLEQINTTADRSDYLWYSSSIDLDAATETVLHIESLGHALHAFVNGKLAGSGTGNHEKVSVKVDIPITLVYGKNTIFT